MQIRTEGPTREEGYSISAEPKLSVLSEKTSAPSVSFMDLMKSIQLRSQKVLEEGQRGSEVREEKPSEVEEPKEPELFSKSEESETEEIGSDEEESEKLVRLSEKKIQKADLSEMESEEDLDSELELETEELDSPFITQMSAFLAGLEAKKEKEVIHAANQEESVSLKKVQKHTKEETPKAEQKEENVSSSKPLKDEEKRTVKDIKKSQEKESLDEGLKNLEEARKFSKPANEEKVLTVLKEAHKENLIPDSENWKITREKKQETLSMVTKSQTAKVAQAEEASSKDSSGKGSQNQDFSQRNGNETTFTLLKAGLGVVEKNQEVSGQNTKSSKTNSTATMDRSQMKENFQRLVQSARLNIVENGRSEATLRLNPRELGRVSLQISVEDNKVQGKILVESDQVLKLFTGDLEQLRKDFKEQGLDLQSLIIELEDSFQMSYDGQDSSRFKEEGDLGFETSNFSNSSDLEEVSEMDSIENPEFAEKNTDKRLNILV
ncbi:flagellar hook-length control protein FliK [Leptospira sarikeiensis]|uniref:Flagellar hook-length control protein FliK n=1 Tax=Leptospira sarikeiensis TaxID=2484943 RepID=A0A4R9KGS6_9LEPT|nr:flagellar hook-length control protein FliK [Leptospira sarikeiensis]TGL64607.1 flagellar hook-length control protein FliK [Leptospira sarikeiensis]